MGSFRPESQRGLGRSGGIYFSTDLSVAPSASVEMTKQHSNNRQKAEKFTFENNIAIAYYPIVNVSWIMGRNYKQSKILKLKAQNCGSPSGGISFVGGHSG